MSFEFEQFLEFIEDNLTTSKDIVKLARKRYKECSAEYRSSESFIDLLQVTESKISSDKKRIFVHLRDFLQALKENADTGKKSAKRGLHDGSTCSSEAESDTNPPKRRRTDESTRANLRRQSRSDQSESDNEDEDDDTSQHSDANNVTVTVAENEEESNMSGTDDDGDNRLNNDGYKVKATVTENGEESDMSDTGDDVSSQHNDVDKVTDDDTGQHYYDDNVTATVTEFAEDSNMSDSGSDSIASPPLVKQGTSKEYNLSDEDGSKNDSNSAENLKNKTISKMYSSSEEEDDHDLETTKHIADIIQQDDDEDSEHESEIKDKKLDSLGNTDAISDPEHIGSPDSSSSIEAQTKDTRKDKIENNVDKNISDVDNEISDVDNKADSDEGLESDSSLEPCSISLTNTSVKTESHKSKNEIEKEQSDSLSDKKRLKELDETNVKSNDGPAEVESDDVQMISDNDDEDEGSKVGQMLDKTEDFTTKHEDCAGYDADKENKKVTKKRVVTSSDDEDPDYAAKAKKFREKYKKKYVVSTGSKKRANSQSQQTKTSPTKIDKRETSEKSPKKTKTKKRSPKKSSPSKSPILIITDSESSDSDFGNCSIKTVKKKKDEKLVTNFKKEFDIQLDNPRIVIGKVSLKKETKVEPNFDDNNEADDFDQMDTGGSDDGNYKTKHSGKLINGAVDSDEDSEHKTKHRTKNENKEKIKVKKRVDFITEARFDKESNKDSNSAHKHKHSDSDLHKASGSPSAFRNKTRDKSSDSEDNADRQDHDDVRPGPSAQDTTETKEDARKRKASNKQIQKLEKLLEKIRDQIEDVRNRELSVDELDSEVSDYLLEDKLQRKFMKVWDKLCELHQAVKTTGRPTDKFFKYQGTRYPDINRKIEKFINKRKTFPDYHDVRNIINKVNKDRRLHLRPREIDDISKEAFTDVGNQLQKRRQKDFISNFHMPGAVNAFSVYDDPALYDTNLKKKLDANKKQAKHKMEQVVEKYAQMQYQVNDKTDDEDEESEDEEEENADPNTGIEDIDQLISAVDNSDSDLNDVANEDDRSGHVNESGPCLEIENLENGRKSTCPPDIPLHKLGQSKHVVEPVIQHHSNPKSKHFADQLGLGVKRKEPDITILSDNDDDNQVKCDGNASGPDDMDCDIEDEHDEPEEHDKKSKTPVDITIITDDEEEDEDVTDEPLELKIAYTRHVSLEDLEKIHREGISSDSDKPLPDSKSVNEQVLADLVKSDHQPVKEKHPERKSEASIEQCKKGESKTKTDTHVAKLKADSVKGKTSDNSWKTEPWKADSVKGKVSDSSWKTETWKKLTAEKSEPDVICIEIDEDDCKATSTSFSKQKQTKCTSKTIHPKTLATPEIVILDMEESITPGNPSTSKRNDNCESKMSQSHVIRLDSLNESNEECQVIEDDDSERTHKELKEDDKSCMLSKASNIENVDSENDNEELPEIESNEVCEVMEDSYVVNEDSEETNKELEEVDKSRTLPEASNIENVESENDNEKVEKIEDNSLLPEDSKIENEESEIRNEDNKEIEKSPMLPEESDIENVDSVKGSYIENVDLENNDEEVEESEADMLSENHDVENEDQDAENEDHAVENEDKDAENEDYDAENEEHDVENEDENEDQDAETEDPDVEKKSEINYDEGEVIEDENMLSEDNEIENEDSEINDEEIEVIPDSMLSEEASDDENSDSDNILVATILKKPSPEKCAIPDVNSDTRDEEHIAGELEEDLANGGSESIPDIFASYESDSKEECNDDDTICENGEVLENGGTVSDSSNDVEEGCDEENDQLNNTSSCDLETIGSLNITLPNVKDKLLKLGTAISTKPSVTCGAQDRDTQEQSDEINSEPDTKRTSRWNDYDENAGLIETYQEPEISVNLRLSQESVIVLSDSE